MSASAAELTRASTARPGPHAATGASRRTRSQLALAIGLGCAASGAGVGLLATSAWLISRAAQQPPVLYLMVAIVAVRAFALVRATARYAERLVAHDAAFRALGALRERVYLRLERLVPAGLGSLSSADAVSRVVGDVDAVVDRLVRVRLPVAVAGLTSAAAVGCVWWLDGPSGAVLAGGVALAWLGVPWLVRLAGGRLEQKLAAARSQLNVETARVLACAPDLIAYGAVDDAVRRVSAADRVLRRIERRSAWSQGLGTAALLATLLGGVCAALLLGIPAVGSGALDPTLLAVVVLIPLGLVDVLGTLPAAAALTDRSRAAMARVDAILTAADPVPDPAEPVALSARSPDLRLRGVRARWSADAPWVLDGLDLDLPYGTRVAISGTSGGGKSTLAAVLLRLLDHEGGRILLADDDVRTLDGDDLRRVVGLCAQDAYVFDTTIRANLLLARPSATEAEVRHALVGARLAGWVDELPRGLDTRVGEHGALMSGGERQRLALARVLLADAPVVVFDEPTEHLDEATGAAIVHDLLAATAGRTVVLLTHRLPPPGAVDTTYQLVGGRLRPVLQDEKSPDPCRSAA